MHNESDALDAVQETSYRAFRSIRKLKEPAFFPTWLVRILLNYCSDERKRKSRYVSSEAVQDMNSWDRHSDPDLTAAIAKLGTTAKQIIILNYYEGFSLTEIAGIMDCPVGTVKSRLHRSLAQLRDELDMKGDEQLNG